MKWYDVYSDGKLKAIVHSNDINKVYRYAIDKYPKTTITIFESSDECCHLYELAFKRDKAYGYVTI